MSNLKTSFKLSQNEYTLVFMILLSLACAVILSVLASSLRVPQEIAREIDRSKQMLIAARILSPYGYFLIKDDQGHYLPAEWKTDAVLTPSHSEAAASDAQILEVYQHRIAPFLVNERGEETTFQKAGMDEKQYSENYRKSGYYLQPWKLIYKIHPNSKDPSLPAEGYVIPVNGMGLWDAIYGFLAIAPDADHVIGISWYDQKETPGLGANIAEPDWQSQFPGKVIFQESADGQTDFKTAALGITVLKGRVKEVLGDSPKALSAVDGMSGATLTGNGVTNAYKSVLEAYRPFLIRIHEAKEKGV